jgi:hypothetical protein
MVNGGSLLRRSGCVYAEYTNHNHRMNYSRKYDARNPETNVRIHEFLKAKHLTGQVEHEFETGNINRPTGWAILQVDTADPKLQLELDCVISNLEKMDAALLE